MKTEFKVTKDMKGNFVISIGIGKTFKCKSLNNVAYGLQHYFQEDLFDNKWNFQKHIEHSKVCDCCPLCDKLKESELK